MSQLKRHYLMSPSYLLISQSILTLTLERVIRRIKRLLRAGGLVIKKIFNYFNDLLEQFILSIPPFKIWDLMNIMNLINSWICAYTFLVTKVLNLRKNESRSTVIRFKSWLKETALFFLSTFAEKLQRCTLMLLREIPWDVALGV